MIPTSHDQESVSKIKNMVNSPVCIHEKSTLRFDSESAFNARKHWACDRCILTGRFGGATQI